MAVSGVLLAAGRGYSARKEVILCAGPYRTTQILVLSGIGSRDVLKTHDIPEVHTSAQVGQNLFDHFVLVLAFKLRNTSKGPSLGSSKLNDPAFFKGVPCDWVINETAPTSLLQNTFDEGQHVPVLERSLLQPSRSQVEAFVIYFSSGVPSIPDDGTHVAASTMLLLPTSRGNVAFASNNPQDPPLIIANY